MCCWIMMWTIISGQTLQIKTDTHKSILKYIKQYIDFYKNVELLRKIFLQGIKNAARCYWKKLKFKSINK